MELELSLTEITRVVEFFWFVLFPENEWKMVEGRRF